jgi:hypothetical protein
MLVGVRNEGSRAHLKTAPVSSPFAQQKSPPWAPLIPPYPRRRTIPSPPPDPRYGLLVNQSPKHTPDELHSSFELS